MATYESSTVKNPRACLINEENTTVHSLIFGLDLGQEAFGSWVDRLRCCLGSHG